MLSSLMGTCVVCHEIAEKDENTCFFRAKAKSGANLVDKNQVERASAKDLAQRLHLELIIETTPQLPSWSRLSPRRHFSDIRLSMY